MPALAGRKVIIRKGEAPTVVAAGRSKSITINAEPIDITSDDDEGVRALLESAAASRSADMSFEGVTKDDTFIADISGGTFVDDYEIEITGIGTLSSKFFITSVAVNGPYNEGSTFSAEFQSTGAVDYEADA